MNITSPAFIEGQPIPAQYTCDGLNVSPPLEIYDVPAEAKSLALVVHDPDVPKVVRPDGVFDHWVLWNIGPRIERIESGGVPAGAIEGCNTAGQTRYAGPCPPDGRHRYVFTLYALDSELAIPGESGRTELLQAVEGHVLAEAVLTGTYDRSPASTSAMT